MSSIVNAYKFCKDKINSQNSKNDLPYQNGFENVDGLSCYRNSVLQALFSLTTLNDYFSEFMNDFEKFHATAINFDIIYAFGRMIEWNHVTKNKSKKHEINNAYRDFSETIWKFEIFTQIIRRTEQQDPHEFLLPLLSHFDTAMQNYLRLKRPESPLEKYPIGKFFTFNLDQIITCPSNHIHSTKRYEVGFTLDLNVQKPIYLQTILNSYFEDKIINNFHCNICKRINRLSKQRIEVNTTPSAIMIIQLIRFENDRTKNFDEVSIPLDIILINTWKYELTAIIFHQGNTIQSKIRLLLYNY